MQRRNYLLKNRLLFLLLILSFISCGRKSPLSVHRHTLPFKVVFLQADKKEGVWVVKGEVIGEKKGYKMSDIIGCRIYYSRFSFDKLPCEECPIYLGKLKEVRKNVIKDKLFYLELPWLDKEGVYYIKIRLLGKGNSIGPASDLLKIVERE